MTKWSAVWWGLVATLLAFALGIPTIAGVSFEVFVIAGLILLATLAAARQALHTMWSEDVDTFAEGLTLVTDALDGASEIAALNTHRPLNWRQLIKSVPWPEVLGRGDPAPGLAGWYTAHKTTLSQPQEDLFAVLRQFEASVHSGDVSLARRRMRVVADRWDGWHFWPGFHYFFRGEVLPYYGDMLKLLAYIEIQHAEHVRSRPGPTKGWVRLGARWSIS